MGNPVHPVNPVKKLRGLRGLCVGILLALMALALHAEPVAVEPPAPRQRPVVAIPDYLQTNDVVSTKRNMTETLLAAGVVPVVLPEMDDAAADRVLSFCDAVLVGGGIAMQDYDRRCAFEERVIALAAKRGLTIVGICHGCQVINRHFGGTLSPVPADGKTVHVSAAYRKRTGKMIEHFATVLPGDSLMSRVFGEGRLKVNSSHTLRCETVAPGFRATALLQNRRPGLSRHGALGGRRRRGGHRARDAADLRLPIPPGILLGGTPEVPGAGKGGAGGEEEEGGECSPMTIATNVHKSQMSISTGRERTISMALF